MLFYLQLFQCASLKDRGHVLKYVIQHCYHPLEFTHQLTFPVQFSIPCSVFRVPLPPCLTACGILVPRPGMEPGPPALEAQS